VSFDGSGNLLISEAGSATIQRLDSAGLLRNVAGNSTGYFTGDGIAATSAGIGPPSNVAVDPAGNLFFADGARIRRVDASTEVISTVAGNGTGTGGAQACISANNGDGGPATDATIDGTMGVALMPNGNLLFSSYADCRVRRIALPSPLAYTATGLSADGSSIGVGQNVTFTARVSPVGAGGAPGGSIQFVDGYPNYTTLASVPLNAGAASLTLSFPTTGYHNVVAYYSGDSLFNSSASPMAAVRVQSPTTVNLTSGQNPAVLNQPVTFTVTIPQLPSPSYQSWGNVTLMDGPTQVGWAMVFNGGAQFTVSFAGAGSHSLTAVFSGSGDYAGSTSAMLIEVVIAKAPSMVALSSSANPSTAGAPITVTATVSPSTATGTIQFLDSGATLGYASLANGAATLNTTSLTAGTHSLTAVYAGDSVVAGSTSNVVTQTVVTATTTTTLSSSAPSSTYGQPLTITATVIPSAATGSVQFLDGATVLGTATLSGGSASISLPLLGAGSHPLTAVYSGNSSNSGSTSAVYTQAVQKADITVSISSSANPSVQGQTISVSAVLSNSTATGTFQFLDGAAVIGTAQVTNGAGGISASTLSSGNRSLTAAYSGDANFNAATSAALIQVVKATSTTTLSADNTSVTWGQTTQLMASVSPSSATGTMQFLDGATVLGSSAVNGGAATLPFSTLAVGGHSITAAYSGDANVTASASAAVALTVAKANSNATVISTLNPSVAGQAVTFTATISPAAVTGSVQFLDGSSVLGTVTVAGGSAALTTSTLSAGSHAITAAYSGDGNYNGVSAGFTQTVKATSATTLSADNTSPTVGQNVLLTAAISPGSATGAVQFLDGGTLVGTSAVSGGSASLAITTLTAGVHSMTASYNGDGNDTPSTSAPVTVTVSKIAASLAVASSVNPSAAGQAVTFTATISPAAATGSVQFLDGATVMGSAILNNGAAVFATSSLAVGDHSVTAKYLGDASSGPSQSAAVLEQVVKRATTSTLASAPNPSTLGMTVTLTATVSPTPATGTVQFLDGATVLGTAPLGGGAAALATTALGVGSHSITAVYGGDSSYAGSTSAAAVQIVNKAPTATAIVSSVNPSTVGQAVTFTATVTPGATGSVQFLYGTTPLGTVALNSGTAALTTSSLPAGFYSIAAVYSGDANYVGSTGYINQSVTRPTTTSLTSDKTSITYGQAVTFTATVSPSSATGVVQFTDGTVLIGTGILSSGQAKLSTVSLTGGSHSVTAVYTGDATNGPSTSAPRAITVAQAKPTVNLVSSQNPIAVGQTVTFTVGINAAVATGTVTFMDGSSVIGTVTLDMSTAAFSTSGLSSGNHSISAVYSGDMNYRTTSSSSLTERVK
jgi:hypothetical protein